MITDSPFTQQITSLSSAGRSQHFLLVYINRHNQNCAGNVSLWFQTEVWLTEKFQKIPEGSFFWVERPGSADLLSCMFKKVRDCSPPWRWNEMLKSFKWQMTANYKVPTQAFNKAVQVNSMVVVKMCWNFAFYSLCSAQNHRENHLGYEHKNILFCLSFSQCKYSRASFFTEGQSEKDNPSGPLLGIQNAYIMYNTQPLAQVWQGTMCGKLFMDWLLGQTKCTPM